MNTETLVFLGIFWFVGLFIGWFFRNGISVVGVIVLFFVFPVFTFLADLDWWPLTASFVFGLLIHTWQPLYRKIQTL